MNRKVTGVSLDTKIQPESAVGENAELRELALDAGQQPVKKNIKRAKAQAPVIQDIPLQESSDITQAQSDDFWHGIRSRRYICPEREHLIRRKH